VALALGPDATGITVVYDPTVYEAARGQGLLDLVTAVDPAVTAVLMIGHNPTLSMLSELLDPAAPDEGLRTAGIAVHQVPGPWRDLTAGAAPLVDTHTARA
jgi:phosphohistidine phosphatase